MALPIDVTDPGQVNAADQAFGVGLPVASPTGVSSPSNLSATNVFPGTGQSRSRFPVSVDQTVDVEPAQTAVRTVDGDDGKPGLGIASTVNDPGLSNVESQAPVGLGLPLEADGDASRPGRAPTDVNPNATIAGQVFGTGTPRNVFV